MARRESSGLTTAVVALGLICATAAAAAAVYTKRKQLWADTAPAAGDRQRSVMEEDEPSASASSPPVVPLALSPAPSGSKVMVVCARGSETASVAERWATQSRAGGAAVGVCPPDLLDSHAKFHSGTYDSVVVEAGEGLGDAVLGEVVKLLKVGGKVSVAFGGDAAAAKRALTFAGFLKVALCPEDDRVFTGERAGWEAGASAPVRLSFSKPKSSTAAVAGVTEKGRIEGTAVKNNGSQNGASSSNGSRSAAGKTWKLALDEEEDGSGEDLVDEDALLESSTPLKRPSENPDRGCATKRRACKDCSCGRAEAEMKEGKTLTESRPVVSVDDVDDALTSACGNCSKGDAFRCAGCPFLGKPAFEKGQEKTIMLLDLDSQQDA